MSKKKKDRAEAQAEMMELMAQDDREVALRAMHNKADEEEDEEDEEEQEDDEEREVEGILGKHRREAKDKLKKKRDKR